MSASLAYTPDAYPPILLEGFLCGVYSGILALYLQCHTSTEGTSNTKKIISYAICGLYLLSVVVFVVDFLVFTSFQLNFQYRIGIVKSVVFGCCDFIAQSILIYRCWIVWSCNICVVIIPSILALAYFGMWLATAGAIFIVEDSIQSTRWASTISIICIVVSMAVNTLVTGLIVCRIFNVFRGSTSAEKSLGVTGGRNLRSVIFVIVESGMALFSIQLVRVILSFPPFTPYNGGFDYIIVTHQMLNGITPTIILVRVSMGLSFDDKRSLEEATGSLRFASDGSSPNSISEMGSIGRQECRDNDFDRSEDIQVMESNGSTKQSNQIT